MPATVWAGMKQGRWQRAAAPGYLFLHLVFLPAGCASGASGGSSTQRVVAIAGAG